MNREVYLEVTVVDTNTSIAYDLSKLTGIIKTFLNLTEIQFIAALSLRKLALIPFRESQQTPPEPIIGATTASFAFLGTTVATVGTLFQIFPHRTNDALVQSGVTGIGYYIRSRLSLFTANIICILKYKFLGKAELTEDVVNEVIVHQVENLVLRLLGLQ
jgi:hypothetical protein